MYHSYLRGKQFELLSIRNSIEKIAEANLIPIIEPVRESQRDIIKCVDVLRDARAEYIIIVNPQCGELESNQLNSDLLIQAIINSDPEVELGFIVDDGTTINQVTTFIATYQNQKISIIHAGRFNDVNLLKSTLNNVRQFNKHIFVESTNSNSYRNQFSGSRRVLIKDGFNRRVRNADYANHSVEFYSDLHSTYTDLGYQGYGDFSIVGDHFSEGGGQAITAALHITYKDSESEIYIKHFLSEPRTVAEDVPILLEEALGKLETFLEDNPLILDWSISCRDLMEIYNDGCKTNLANIKKLTLSHHFELMHYIN